MHPDTRRMLFDDGAWIDWQEGYTTAGIDGVVSADGRSYSGTVLYDSCGAFDLVLP